MITRQVAAEGVPASSSSPTSRTSTAAPGFAAGRRASATATSWTHPARAARGSPGVTVLVYDQTCAAEKRRRRKRGTFPDPAVRVFINELVCEGCGDCARKSNCLAVVPVETEFGRKRAIDQSTCNKDYSCVKGFCPSFVTVHGGAAGAQASKARAAADDFAACPSPSCRRSTEPYGILVTGVGGTGVVTIGALLGMAAHLEGKGATVLDMTGLAQKGGAVMSHVRIAARPRTALRACASRPARPTCCSAATSSSRPATTPWPRPRQAAPAPSSTPARPSPATSCATPTIPSRSPPWRRR
jgi:indolepyruvate ferredoxin oxidoreductase